MRQQDGLNRLRKSLLDIAKVKSNDRAVYTEGVELLAAEKAEDDASRRKFGTDRWTREASEAAAPKLYTTSQEIDGYFTSAQSSDNLVEQKLRDSEAVFRVLTGTNRDLEAFVPSSRRATIPPEVEREVSRLRSCISEVNRLESRRKRKAQAVKDKARTDDISPALVREAARLEREFPMQAIQASQFEDLFESRLRDYDVDLDMVAQEMRDQDQIVAQVREANRAFTRAHTGDASTKEREKALQELENGYLKYKEIISNIEVGRKFYNDLAKIVGRFRDDVKAFVHKRRMEASQLEQCVFPSFLFYYSIFPFYSRLMRYRDISSVAAMASLNISPIRQPPQQTAVSAPAPVSASASVPAPTHFDPVKPQPQPPSQAISPQSQPQPQPQPLRPPLTAPQPTRSVPQVTPGMWSPEMGIRFGLGGATAQQSQQTWDPSKGMKFS
jgi:programmed cell death 6-interacting protein